MIEPRCVKYFAAVVVVIFACVTGGAGIGEGETETGLFTLEQRMQRRVQRIEFRDTPIADVVRAIAEQADVDIVVSPKVSGNVTVKLTNVPLAEALDNILTAHGYGYAADEHVIRVAPREDIAQTSEALVTRIYRIADMDVSEVEAGLKKIVSKRGSVSSNASTGTVVVTDTETKIQTIDQLIEAIAQTSEALVTQIYRITYADVTEIEKALAKIISDRGKISSNAGTSNIIVTDTQSRIEAIDSFIEEIDRVTPQILVEARIYDITSKDRLDLGVEWQVGRNTTYSTNGATAYGADGITAIGHNPLSGEDTAFVSGLFSGATGNTGSTTGALRVGWLSANLDVDALLKAQQENIDAKLLANPRILVLDNENAQIKIISEIPYQELTESALGGTMGTTSFREVGVELQVTPHVTREDMIRVQLRPKFSVVTGEVMVSGFTKTIPQPVVDRREAETTLLIQNGQTVVLGGLRKREVTQQTNKVPFLGDLPILGALFKFEGEDTVTSELVVFITPRIVTQPMMSGTEQQQFEVTEFEGPTPDFSRAEKSGK